MKKILLVLAVLSAAGSARADLTLLGDDYFSDRCDAAGGFYIDHRNIGDICAQMGGSHRGVFECWTTDPTRVPMTRQIKIPTGCLTCNPAKNKDGVCKVIPFEQEQELAQKHFARKRLAAVFVGTVALLLCIGLLIRHKMRKKK